MVRYFVAFCGPNGKSGYERRRGTPLSPNSLPKSQPLSSLHTHRVRSKALVVHHGVHHDSVPLPNRRVRAHAGRQARRQQQPERRQHAGLHLLLRRGHVDGELKICFDLPVRWLVGREVRCVRSADWTTADEQAIQLIKGTSLELPSEKNRRERARRLVQIHVSWILDSVGWVIFRSRIRQHALDTWNPTRSDLPLASPKTS